MSSLPPEIVADPDRVQAWSSFRLPFETKAAGVRRFRDALRASIRGLARRPGLRAVYQSADQTTCDVENVVLYNVGSAPFRGLGTDQLLVERPRGFSPRSPSGAPLVHYLGYEALATSCDWRTWRPHRKLAAWRAAPVQGEFTVTNIWAALKRGAVDVHRGWGGTRRIGVVVHVPGSRSLVEAIKPLVDAVVSAAHVQKGPDPVGAVQLMAAALDEREDVVSGWLTDAASGVLGPHRVVVPRATSLQWNPRDDLVAAIRLERTSTDAVEAELWTLAPVVPD